METKEKITTNTILDFLKEKVEIKSQLNPDIWIDAAQKLAVLLGDEESILYDLQQKVASLKVMLLDGQEKRNVSEVKLRVEASEEYKAWKKQEAKVRQIEEFIRVAKLRARISAGGI